MKRGDVCLKFLRGFAAAAVVGNTHLQIIIE
jgi:hypothetical protein